MIRVVAGELRGRRLAIGPGVRPTTERAREALFSMLGDRVRGARVLDAAAGSGALGFEALSRGAREVVFVEADRRVARVLESNAESVGLAARTRILVRTVASFLVRDVPTGFDLVFFDPPWADPVEGELAGLWRAVVPGGTFVVERGSGAAPWTEPPVAADVRRYGTTSLFLYEKPAREGGGADDATSRAERGDAGGVDPASDGS